jgi:hypothetical protein
VLSKRSPPVLVLVPEGKRPSLAFGRDPDVQIAHMPDSMLAEGGVIGRDFRKRDEREPGSTSR